MIRTFLFIIALWLVLIGSINWGLVGIFNIDLVSLFFGNMTKLSRIIYGVIGVSGIYLAVECILQALKPKEDVISWPPLDQDRMIYANKILDDEYYSTLLEMFITGRFRMMVKTLWKLF